jgi:uncharacterized protein (UPF0276 family)
MTARGGERAGVALMQEPAFEPAIAPLLAAGSIGVVEWSFDTCWDEAARPRWLRTLLDRYAARGRLLGHGVTLSPLSAGDERRQQAWLARCAGECTRRRYARVSEHLGFTTAGGWRDGAPLPVPASAAAIATGRDALARLADAAGAPVGLENLAFAFGRDDVAREGELLEALLAPGDGFLLLDLHNLWCRSVNFDLSFPTLLASYPLARVRELHLSGGSVRTAFGVPVRRDTHDDRVPDELFALLPDVLRRCRGVDAVILEQLGRTLADPAAAQRFRDDFLRLRAICDAS